MSEAIDKTPPYSENPAIPDENPTRPGFATGTNEERPSELESRLDEIEQRDLRGQEGEKPRPYAMPGEDEGPLGEGGQLRGPDAGGGGSS